VSPEEVPRAVGRPTPELVAAYRKVASCYSASCVFSDAQARQGTLASAIRPILSGKLVGPAVTVRLSPGDLQDPLDALEVAEPGDVVVVDAGGETETAVWGGLMGTLAHARSVAGAIINGAVRDIDELRDIPFQVFSRAIVPRGTHTMLSTRRSEVVLNVPVNAGGVVVFPGDMVIADDVGVTVVPFDSLESVLTLAREQADREQATRDRVAGGTVSIREILDEFGRL
jgi:4-hydroxy-4-methyl-2-oxoglutarate aldolase